MSSILLTLILASLTLSATAETLILSSYTMQNSQGGARIEIDYHFEYSQGNKGRVTYAVLDKISLQAGLKPQEISIRIDGNPFYLQNTKGPSYMNISFSCHTPPCSIDLKGKDKRLTVISEYAYSPTSYYTHFAQFTVNGEDLIDPLADSSRRSVFQLMF